MSSDVRLGAGSWTSAGAAKPRTEDERSPVPLADRVAAVSRAGFVSFGIGLPDLRALKRQELVALRSLLDDHGIEELELEFLDGWYATDSEVRARSDRDRSFLLGIADQAKADRIKVGGDFRPVPLVVDVAAEELRVLARQADDVGAVIALEGMPFADIPSPFEALEVVEAADMPSAGVFIDNWHVARSGHTVGELASIPGKRIAGVELSDAPAVPTTPNVIDETFDYREFPGEGGLDIAGFVEAIRGTGYAGTWGVEMLSAQYRELPLNVALERAYLTTSAFLRDDPQSRSPLPATL